MAGKEFRLNLLQHVFIILLGFTVLYQLFLEVSITQTISFPPWRVAGGCLLPFIIWFKLNNDTHGIKRIIANQRNKKEKLITDGWYRFSRNPCYLAQALSMGCYLLLAPSWWGLVFYIGFLVTVNATIVAEERRLQALFGHQYTAYKRVVGRWTLSPLQLLVMRQTQ